MGFGRIVLSALVDNESTVLGLGIDVQKPQGTDLLQCAFIIAELKENMKIDKLNSYPISACTDNEVDKPVFITAVSYDSPRALTFGAISGELTLLFALEKRGSKSLEIK